jgi:hypothetical protein
MRLEFSYNFEIQEAKERVRALTDYWGAKYGVKTDWTERTAKISGKVRGASFAGDVTFEQGRAVAEMKVSMLAEMLGGRAYVERKMHEYLDPANAIEALRSRIP